MSAPASGSQAVLSSRTESPVRVQTPHLDGEGAARGLVGVSWSILEPGVGLSSWTISSEALGSTSGYVIRDRGSSSVTTALVKLPPGTLYALQMTFTDMLGRSSTTQVGKVLVPYDDRWSALHYSGHWQHLKQAGAWLDTVSRAGAGARVSVTLDAGRPLFLLRATRDAAQVEVRAGVLRQVFAVAPGSSIAPRLIAAGDHSHRGTVSLRVLRGTIELDGVAVEH